MNGCPMIAHYFLQAIYQLSMEDHIELGVNVLGRIIGPSRFADWT